jgi:hypothetical protein
MKGTKHQVYYDRAKAQNQALFDSFKEIHDLYVFNPAKWEQQFNTQGLPVLDILRATERQLCAGMERGKFGAFSNKVAEKFWQTVKKEYSHIEFVGVVRKFVNT